jgi:alpha-methylacyl-CoA racemase
MPRRAREAVIVAAANGPHVGAAGALAGVRVLELGGIGPGPFAAMMLADMGAEIVRIERPGGLSVEPPDSVLLRGRGAVALDLKTEAGLDLARQLATRVDVLIEGFRPGVTERLGLGPDWCLEHNPRLVYGRTTGWGQDGPYAGVAGHDINYLAASGALDAIGRRGQPPAVPLNLIGDDGAGGMLLVYGLLLALFERERSGAGQVVDAAMSDGLALMMGEYMSLLHAGRWNPERGSNEADSGAHYYDVYRTADDRFVAVGAIEPAFYRAFVERLGLPHLPQCADDPARWPDLKEQVAGVFATDTRDAWIARFEGVDACITPVLTLEEAAGNEHHLARGTLVERDGRVEPAPAPRLSRTPGALRGDTPDAQAVMARWLADDRAHQLG